MKKIIFCLFVTSTFLCFSQDRLGMHHVDKITIPNDTIAYFKADMSLVNGMVYDQYPNGGFKYKIEYKNGLRHGIFNLWNYSGQITHELVFKNGKRHGECKWRNDYGQLTDIETYSYGNYNGEVSRWYENGQLKSENNYHKGEKMAYVNHGTITGN